MRRSAPVRIAFVTTTLMAMFASLTAGCGPSGNRSSSISGKFVYKGSPVTGGGVILHHSSGEFPTNLNPDGKLILENLPDGDVVITIETESIKDPGMAALPHLTGQEKVDAEKAASNTSAAGTYMAIPKKYASATTSDLKFTLKKGKNDLGEITLKD